MSLEEIYEGLRTIVNFTTAKTATDSNISLHLLLFPLYLLFLFLLFTSTNTTFTITNTISCVYVSSDASYKT